MGNSSSEEITTDLLIKSVRSVNSDLSDRDRKLFNHAKFALAQDEEKCNDCELFIDFEDQAGLTIQTNDKPSGRILVGFDEHNKPKYVWEKRGFWRATKRFFIKCWRSLLNAASLVAGAIAGVTQPAIGF